MDAIQVINGIPCLVNADGGPTEIAECDTCGEGLTRMKNDWVSRNKHKTTCFRNSVTPAMYNKVSKLIAQHHKPVMMSYGKFFIVHKQFF